MTHASQSFERADSVRDAYATELFNIDRINTQISDAADKGYRQIQINQEYPFTLQNFRAAQHLESWLDDNGYRYIWQTVYVPKDFLHPNTGHEYLELEITW